MKTENPSNLIKPIESIEEFNKKLGIDRHKIQLQYVDKLLRGEIKIGNYDVSPENMRAMLVDFTWVTYEVAEQYALRAENPTKEGENQYLENILNNIVSIYKQDPQNWQDKAFSEIEEEAKLLGEIKEDRKDKKPSNRIEAGLFWVKVGTGFGGVFKCYGIENRVDWEKSKFANIFNETGIDYDDECLSVNIDPLYKQDKNKGATFSINDNFKKISSEIIKNSPQVKAIIIESWLLDTEVGKNSGFTTCYSWNVPENSYSFWGQFLDRNGKIKQKEVEEFLKKGEPKYHTKIGYMKTEDFLSKYPSGEQKK